MNVINRNEYLSKVNGCWLGKNIGGTLGAPFEWHRQINNVTFYAQKLDGNPLPNDDLDIQLLWLIALEEQGINIQSRMLSEYWSIFVTPHWAEYGIAKANLRSGVVPPLSGYLNNGYRHSCGAFIRSEIWACISPGLPAIAAKYAYEDAIIDHGVDAEGLYAEVFCATMESAAFVEKDVYKLIDIGLSYIPEDCGVARAVSCAVQCYKSGLSWLEARNEILEKYRGSTAFGLRSVISDADVERGFFDGVMGWDAPSNIAIIIVGILYGEGDFAKSVCIAVNCGEDTDCTGATVGALLGIIHGDKYIPGEWVKPIGHAIKTACLNLGELGFYGNMIPADIEALTQRVERVMKQVLLANPANIEVSEAPTDLTKLNRQALLAGDQRAALYADALGPVYPFDLFDVSVQYCDGPVVASGVDCRIQLKVKNKYKVQSNVEFKWYAEDGWQISPLRSGMFYLPGTVNCINNDNIAVLDFMLRNDDIRTVKSRFAVEFVVEGKPTVMLVPVLLLNSI